MPSSSHRPRKRFGQHFLHDAGVLRRIVEAIAPAPSDFIVEIGPGEFSFGGDQNCKADAAGRIGHLSGQVGDSPCLQLVIQNNDPQAWVGARPGAFK